MWLNLKFALQNEYYGIADIMYDVMHTIRNKECHSDIAEAIESSPAKA